MNIKHKVVKDFQLLTSDKKIVILKTGTIIEEYKFSSKGDIVHIDKDIIDSNPDFFLLIDWKAELLGVIKTNKIPQPSQVVKKLIPFIEEMFILTTDTSDKMATVDLTADLKNIKSLEQELEFKEAKLSKKESLLKEESLLIEEKESDVRRKSKELREKEEELFDMELELKRKSRQLDVQISENSNNIKYDSSEAEKKAKKLVDDAKEEAHSLIAQAEKKIQDANKAYNKKIQEADNYKEDYIEKVKDNIIDKLKDQLLQSLHHMSGDPNISTKADVIRKVKSILDHF